MMNKRDHLLTLCSQAMNLYMARMSLNSPPITSLWLGRHLALPHTFNFSENMSKC